MMLYININDIPIVIVKNVDYCCIDYDISKSEVINLLKKFSTWKSLIHMKMQIKEINIKNRVYNYYFDNLIKAKS